MSAHVEGKGHFHKESFQLPSSHLSLYSIAFRPVEAPICSSRTSTHVPRPPILHDLMAIKRCAVHKRHVPLTAYIDNPIPHYQPTITQGQSFLPNIPLYQCIPDFPLQVRFNRPLVSLSAPFQHLLPPTPPVDFLACHDIVFRGDYAWKLQGQNVVALTAWRHFNSRCGCCAFNRGRGAVRGPRAVDRLVACGKSYPVLVTETTMLR